MRAMRGGRTGRGARGGLCAGAVLPKLRRSVATPRRRRRRAQPVGRVRGGDPLSGRRAHELGYAAGDHVVVTSGDDEVVLRLAGGADDLLEHVQLSGLEICLNHGCRAGRPHDGRCSRRRRMSVSGAFTDVLTARTSSASTKDSRQSTNTSSRTCWRSCSTARTSPAAPSCLATQSRAASGSKVITSARTPLPSSVGGSSIHTASKSMTSARSTRSGCCRTVHLQTRRSPSRRARDTA